MPLPSTSLLPSTGLLPDAPTLLNSIIVEFKFDGTNWTNASAYMRAGSITRGASRFDGAIVSYEAGTASVTLDNRDARFDSTNLSGPYVDASGASQCRPWIQWRIRSTSGAGYPLWLGFVTNWAMGYAGAGKDAVAVVSGVDIRAVLERWNATTAWSPELSGARIANLMSRVLWPDPAASWPVTADAGQVTVLGIPDYSTNNSSTWAEMQTVADTELGELFVNAAGTVVFRQRDAFRTNALSNTSQGTFGTSGAELRYLDVTFANDDVQLFSRVTVTRNGGTAQAAQNLDSFYAFGGNRYLSMSGLLLQSDAEALDLAGYVLALLDGVDYSGATPILVGDLRVASLTIDPRVDPTNLNPQVLGRELGDRITVIARPVGRTASPIQRDAWIRGIAHTWTPDSWLTTWSLQDATRFAAFTFDDATYGRLDYNFFGA